MAGSNCFTHSILHGTRGLHTCIFSGNMRSHNSQLYCFDSPQGKCLIPLCLVFLIRYRHCRYVLVTFAPRTRDCTGSVCMWRSLNVVLQASYAMLCSTIRQGEFKGHRGAHPVPCKIAEIKKKQLTYSIPNLCNQRPLD